MNITDIINSQPNTWVDDFQGIPTNLQQKQGKSGPWFVGKLKDPAFPSVQIDATFFRADMMNYADKVVHFAGQGMKRDEYNGTPKVVIGQKATIQILGNPVADRQAREASQGYQQAPQQAYQQSQPYQQPQQQSQAAPTAAHTPVMGVTVGMAINNACNLVAALGGSSESLQEHIYNLASDIIRISRTLEKGNLAPKASDRNSAPPQQQQSAPPPPPVQAPPPQEAYPADDFEDVPF